MRIKISLLSSLLFLLLGTLFFLSSPQKADACTNWCSACNTRAYWVGTYCTSGPIYLPDPTCTAGCPVTTPPPGTVSCTGCSGTSCYLYYPSGCFTNCSACPGGTPNPGGGTPTPTPSGGGTPTPTPAANCSQCISGTCTPYFTPVCGTNCSLCPGGTPTPTPSGTPTPTPGPTYTVSGNVFVDANKNKKFDAGTEQNYAGGITITSVDSASGLSSGTVVVDNPSAGTYTVSGLPAGSYTISYTSTLPTGYQMTYPVNGPPPSFTVSVGTGNCSVGGSNSAVCDSPASGDITSLNFGMTNSLPWVQSGGGGDIRADSGFNPGGSGGLGGGGTGASFNNPIPSTASLSCSGGAYTSVSSGAGSPGIVYTGNGSAYFGQGSASVNNWVAGGVTNPESFGPIGIGGIIKTSYAYMQSVAQQASITPIDLTSDSSFCSLGGLTNCRLSSSLPHNIYVTNGSLTLTGSGTPASYTFPSNQSYIILVNGDLNIQTQLHVPVGSTVMFSVSGNINVDKSVGEIYSSTATDLEGVYSTDKSFIIQGINDCTVGADSRLNIAGSVIVNAALGGGSVQNQRDLCANNLYCPVFSIQSRPDFILNAPNFIKKANYTWQEAAP